MPRNHLGEKEYQTFAGWKRAALKAYPGATMRGNKDIGALQINGVDVAEWGGDVGSVYEKEQVAATMQKNGIPTETEYLRRNPARKIAKHKRNVKAPFVARWWKKYDNYLVETHSKGESWLIVSLHETRASAIKSAYSYKNEYPHKWVRVVKKSNKEMLGLTRR